MLLPPTLTEEHCLSLIALLPHPPSQRGLWPSCSSCERCRIPRGQWEEWIGGAEHKAEDPAHNVSDLNRKHLCKIEWNRWNWACQECTDILKQGVERISHRSTITPSTKLKSQSILGAENVPGFAFVFQKHWTPLVSESRALWLSLTWAGTRRRSHSPLRTFEGLFCWLRL